MFKSRRKIWPQSIIIEATNICNLQCPVCPTYLDMKRPKGFMEEDTFKSIIQDIEGRINNIALNFAGEPTLNKNLWNFITYANEKGIKSLISTNTTLLHKQYKEMIAARPDEVIVCLDGASKSIHESYRRGSDFDKIVYGITKACEEKKKQGASKPHITLQFVVMAQNEHQINDIINLGQKMGVDSVLLKTMSLGSDIEMDEKLKRAEKWLPKNDKYNRYSKDPQKVKITNQPRFCTISDSAVIYWDGIVGTCCYDFNGVNFRSHIDKYDGFSNLYRSEEWKAIKNKMKLKKFPLCKKCNLTSGISKRITINHS